MSSRTSAKSRGWKASSVEWWEKESGKHELFVSDEVIAELADPDFQDSEQALNMTRGLSLLQLNEEVLQFAEVLVHQRVMPGPSNAGDALHVAVATLFGMNYVLTWNVKHLANENKRTHLAVICMRLGLVPPTIVTPDML